MIQLQEEGKAYKSEDFSKKVLDNSTFTHCTFNHCNFSECFLRNSKFCFCTFVDCNLSLIKIEGTRLQEVQFQECKIVGVEFFKCEKLFFSVCFKNCLLHYCNFSDLPMKNGRFHGSKLKENHFTNTCLIGADFSGVDLTGTIFHNCDLSKADFSTAVHYNIDPQTNKIKHAKFSLPEAIGLLRAFDVTIV